MLSKNYVTEFKCTWVKSEIFENYQLGKKKCAKEMESCRLPSNISLMTSKPKFKRRNLGEVQSKNFHGKSETLTILEGRFYLS